MAGFLGLLFVVFRWSGLQEHFSLAFVQQKFLDNKLSGMLIFVALFSLGNLVQIPGWIFLAAAVSCAVTFWVIRLFGGDALRQLKGQWARRLLAQLDARPISSIALLRILFQTVPALNYALALSGVKFRSYLMGSVLGLPLQIALYCFFFDYLAQALHLAVA